MQELGFFVSDPATPDVRALLETHLAFAHEVTPAGHVHALDVEALRGPALTLFAARRPGRMEGELVAVAALQRLGPGDVEVKSMHVRSAARGAGVGRLVLDHLLAVARSRRARRVRLETGTGPAFAAATAMYRSAGFVRCPPFGAYTDNPHSACFALDLPAPGPPLPVLIGPVCAGKTTLLPLVSAALGRPGPGVDLDTVAEAYYDEVGRSRAALHEVGAREGDLGAFRWWQEGHPHAVERFVVDHADEVLALGAGHSVYDDPALFERVRVALEGREPVLVLPSPDLDRSVQVLRDRSKSGRGMDWVLGDVDVLDLWVRSPQNHGLAARTVFTEGRTPAEVAAEIAGPGTDGGAMLLHEQR